jgi:hypothetical protein
MFNINQSYFMTGDLPPISWSWRQAPWDSRQYFFFQLNTCFHSPCVITSLTRGWTCRLQLLLALASAVILGSGSRGTYDHRWVNIPELFLDSGSVNTFLLPGSRFLILQQLEHNYRSAVFYVVRAERLQAGQGYSLAQYPVPGGITGPPCPWGI